MIRYPIEFHSNAEVTFGKQTPWLVECVGGQSNCAIPKEFGGSGVALSPEDLFLHSLISCFVGMFKVLAENSKLAFSGFHCGARLVVAPETDGAKPMMKEFFLNVTFQGIADEAKTRLLAKKAFESGFILNSVKTKCSLELEFPAS